MLLEILVAATIGLSFGNAWTCIFMSFGASAENRTVGKWFIAGRFLGLILLGSAISLLRFAAQDAMPYILVIFGISTLAFGIFMLFRQVMKTHFVKEHPNSHPGGYPSNRFITSLLSFFLVLPNCKMDGRGCRKKHHECKHKKSNIKKKYGFTLGLLRGATPCLKVVVLAPLLVAVGFPSSLLLISIFALTSTVYPVIGYLSADILNKFEKHQMTLKIAGALILIAIGIYAIFNAVVWGAIHCGT